MKRNIKISPTGRTTGSVRVNIRVKPVSCDVGEFQRGFNGTTGERANGR